MIMIMIKLCDWSLPPPTASLFTKLNIAQAFQNCALFRKHFEGSGGLHCACVCPKKTDVSHFSSTKGYRQVCCNLVPRFSLLPSVLLRRDG